MATQTFIQPYYSKSTLVRMSPGLHGGNEASYFKEAASQTWVVGDLIYLASGKLTVCGLTSTKLNTPIAGQALVAATGVTDTAVNFRVIRPDDVYAMNVYHATAASAITAITNLGTSYGIIKPTASGSKWVVDIENTTIEDGTTALGKVQVVGFPDFNPADGVANTIGDTYGLVYVKFLPFTIETDGGNIIRNLQLA
jgi:hypothetical protein